MTVIENDPHTEYIEATPTEISFDEKTGETTYRGIVRAMEIQESSAEINESLLMIVFVDNTIIWLFKNNRIPFYLKKVEIVTDLLEEEVEIEGRGPIIVERELIKKINVLAAVKK